MKRTKHFTILSLVAIFYISSICPVLAQDGSLDISFGSNGIVTTPIGPGIDYAESVAIQSDGKIVVAGVTQGNNDWDFALARYNSDGSLDNTFGSNGIVVTQIGSSYNYAYSLAIQSDGKIVVAGDSYNGINYDFAVVRYNSDGSLDNTFGSNGIVTTEFGSDDSGNSVAIQPDGKIVVAGFSHQGNDDFAVARYNIDGSLDNSFDSDGKVTTPIGSDDYAYGVAIQPDGKIVVSGRAKINNQRDYAVVRYNSDGSLDNTFDSDGKVTTPIGSGEDWGSSVALLSDGKILVSGYSENGSSGDFAIVRYNSDGSLDDGFSSDGIVTTPVGSVSAEAVGIVIQSDNKIVIAGTYNYGNGTKFAAARYNNDGLLDNTFGSNGIVTTQIGGGSGSVCLALQSNGKIVAAGASDHAFAVVRYNNPSVTAVYNDLDLPIEFTLSQNYPNPFNPLTIINYQLRINNFVSLKVFDVLGNEVSTLVNEEKPAGNYSVNFNASNLSSGIYFCTLSSGKFTETKKMILIK